MKTILLDAAPLILLAKLNLLDALYERFRIVIPLEVAAESTVRKDLADAIYIQKLIMEKRIHTKKVSPSRVLHIHKEWGLGMGESAMLALAQSELIVMVTDDFAAMRVAKTMRLIFTTTPMIIVELRNQNILSLELARAKLAELQKHAWISPQILNRVKLVLEGGI